MGRTVLAFTGLLVAVAAGGRAEVPPLVEAELPQLAGLIKPPAAGEAWEQIPWLSSLWQARQQAAKEGKPILLWEMDGHPLGCT
jgi:hypothetical protein